LKKKNEKKNEENKEEKAAEENKGSIGSSRWNFNSSNFKYPLYGIGAGISAGVALGSALLFSLYLIKPK